MNLNPQQQAAAFAPATDRIRVTATAGSGKTTLLLSRMEHLFQHAPGDMTLLAFNKSIVTELKEKVPKKINAFAAARVTIDTSYGFAYKLVKRNFKLLNFSEFPEVPPDWKLYAAMGKAAKALGFPLSEAFIKSLLAADSYRLGSGDPAGYRAYANMNQTFQKVLGLHGEQRLEGLCDKLYAHRRSIGMITFTDMMRLALELPESIYADLDILHLLVDEAQDLNWQQHELISRVGRYNQSMTFVGDRNQAIYGFAGARPDIFDAIPTTYGATDYVLEINYRSKEPILVAANHVLADPRVATDLRLKPNGPQPGIPLQAFVEPKHVVPWLRSYLDGGVPAEDIAIIFRARSHTMELEYLLAKEGIPYHCSSGSFFDHRVIQDVMSYFTLVYELNRELKEEAWHTMAKHIRFMPKQLIEEAWTQNPGAPWNFKPKEFKNHNQSYTWKVAPTRMREVENWMKEEMPFEVVRRIIDNYLKDAWDEDSADDPEKQREYRMMTDAVRSLAANFETAREFYEYYVKRPQADTKEGVSIISAHKSKGLEFRIVAIWNAGEGSFPLKEDEPDEIRLVYVAVTRAKEELAIFASTKDRSGGLLGRITPDPLSELKAIWS